MKTFITAFTLLLVCTLQAQNFTGKAIYKTSQKSNFKMNNEKGVDDKMQEELRKRIQKMYQKTFILEFDKTTSTYKEDIKLEEPKPQVGGNNVVVMSFGGSGAASVYYKNIQEKRFANQTEIMGKVFLVKDSLPKYDWQMTTETKNIGQYTCYKATYTEEVESKKISIVNGETKEDVKKETKVTTAWYTLQVPINNGPDNYQGLPGLILEINDGKRMIVCTEIVLNPSEKITIQEPAKGKVVNQNKFDEIQEQKSKEMMEKFKSRNGFDMGNGVQVKIGG
ncbi:GLPGLI family protein [Polaribacter vadi]|uniref:GLPGLI family protein n=1 Tax=Polaribacter TaxID=52959 RepID=UPI001C085C86|nr:MULTISPECIES: GLPGLI family protein [Polaribacter]MBU3010612.1 GLPGLI family protein [Polaribacter vadi]MDO6740423.1 GLPGLI family protein [Polaribacter sp. 1_MG-2023]